MTSGCCCKTCNDTVDTNRFTLSAYCAVPSTVRMTFFVDSVINVCNTSEFACTGFE